MSFSVAVGGASGYAGGEVLRLLAGHPEARIGAVAAYTAAGQELAASHPHLAALAGKTLVPISAEALAGHDVIILALPHGQSGALAAELERLSPDSVLVDLGADHRLESAQDWADYYGGAHPGSWTYGLPELLTGWRRAEAGGASRAGAAAAPGQPAASAAAPGAPPQARPAALDQPKQRAALRGARRIAVPGCNVSAVTVALAPGIAAGTLAPGDLVAVLANGVSGAGKAPQAHLMASEILGAASPYAVGGSHRHIPEILQNLRRAQGGPAGPGGAAPPVWEGQPSLPDGVRPASAGPAALAGAGPASISFTPTLVPMARGILATATARPGPDFDPARLREPWAQAYDGEAFVHLLPPGAWPSTAHTLGANTALVQVAFDQRAGRVVAIAALDNMVKGAAGAAIQCINLALGYPEGAGLTQNGVAP
jgi:N-acetyl-gamma-glutamyl-phosphate reductase